MLGLDNQNIWKVIRRMDLQLEVWGPHDFEIFKIKTDQIFQNNKIIW